MPSKDLIATIFKWLNRSINSRNRNNNMKKNNIDSNVEKALLDLKVTQIAEAHLGDSYGTNNIDVPLVDYSDKINHFRNTLQESYKQRY
ncbi:MAG TPA: hypothetical protein DCZ30_04400 [Clostridiales bacterium]|nr:hypothetical protein [Clostridiales bacterium]